MPVSRSADDGDEPLRFRSDASKNAERLRSERTRRFEDVFALRVPDRIPVLLRAGYFLAEWGGITKQKLVEDHELRQQILESAAFHFRPDAIVGLGSELEPSLTLGDRTVAFPGYGVGPESSFQFVEREFMLPEDYEPFLRDPSDWLLRTYLPRAFSSLEGLSQMTPLGMWGAGHYHLRNLAAFHTAGVRESIEALLRGAAAQAESLQRTLDSFSKMEKKGFARPPYSGFILLAPFDFMSDMLRGMRGIMLDMRRRPEALLEAERRMLQTQLEHVRLLRASTGVSRVFVPLHRGSDGFMSMEQFERFYWPQLYDLLVGLVEEEVMPVVFYEGVWNQRLEYLSTLPPGRTVGMFQSSDMALVKSAIGDVMCIIGGMENSLLATGTVEEIRETTKSLCQSVGEGGGFVMSTTIGEMEGCDPELVEAWVDATHEFGTY